MMQKDMLRMADLDAGNVQRVLETAISLKHGRTTYSLAGQTIALLFEKQSLRTRVSFDVAMNRLGGHTINLSPEEVGMGDREPIEDIARVLSRYANGIVLRTFSQDTIDQMARYATVPVINALSDSEHPCQALADILTILEHKERLRGLEIAYIGDGNNVASSLATACSLVGASFRIASPPGYALPSETVAGVNEMHKAHGGTFTQVENPEDAVQGADVVYTDVWVSMGQNAEREERLTAFQGYQVNSALMAQAKPDAIFMHDLPAHRGEEISHDMLDHPQSVVFDQAENRLHAQQALLALLLGASESS